MGEGGVEQKSWWIQHKELLPTEAPSTNKNGNVSVKSKNDDIGEGSAGGASSEG